MKSKIHNTKKLWGGTEGLFCPFFNPMVCASVPLTHFRKEIIMNPMMPEMVTMPEICIAALCCVVAWVVLYGAHLNENHKHELYGGCKKDGEE